MGSHGRKTAYHKSIDDAYQKGLDDFYRWCDEGKRRFRTEMLAALAEHMRRTVDGPGEGSTGISRAVSQDGKSPGDHTGT
jgi:hypothetical protein